jgi:hypothetical protein
MEVETAALVKTLPFVLPPSAFSSPTLSTTL